MRFALLLILSLSACGVDAGHRCNPSPDNNPADNQCNSGQCVTPSNCSASYCCAVDADGGISDSHPSCQACPSGN